MKPVSSRHITAGQTENPPRPRTHTWVQTFVGAHKTQTGSVTLNVSLNVCFPASSFRQFSGSGTSFVPKQEEDHKYLQRRPRPFLKLVFLTDGWLLWMYWGVTVEAASLQFS